MKIAMANDHAGTALKNEIKAYLESEGHEVKDFGTYDNESCDLSDFVYPAALAVAKGECDCGVFVDGVGYGSAMIANVFGAKVRDYTPPDRVGLFQGVRMVFNIMIPMCIGPVITALINNINKANTIGYDAAGNAIFNYSSSMFLFGAVLVLLVLIPLGMLKKFEAKEAALTPAAPPSGE